MILFTARMKQLVAIVLDRDVEKVTKELLHQSVLHFISITEIGDGWNSKVDALTPQLSEALIGEIRKRIESFLSLKGYRPESGRELDVKNLKPVDLDETNKILDKIGAGLQDIRNRQRTIQQEILRLEDIKRQLELFGDINAGIQARSQYSFLNIQTGTMQSSRLEAFSSALKLIPSVQLNFQEEENYTYLLLITMKRDDARLDKILDKYGWADVELPREMSGVKEEVMTDLETKMTGLRKEQDRLNDEVQGLIEEKRESLGKMWANLRMNELFYKIQSYFSKTARTMLFSGWLPASKQKALERGIKEAARGRCYLEWNEAKQLQKDEKKSVTVPVQFKNPKFLAPFQMLVQNYSIPRYGTIDPTPFVAIAFLLMFGLMFGDAGHGAVLFTLGLIGSILYKGKKEGLHNLLRLITWCGGSAIVTGILFGSYFGMQWIKPLWFDYHGIISGHSQGAGFVKDIYGILVITIYFGISVIGLGLIINWINRIAGQQWLKLLLDKGGLIGGWIYGAGVYVAYYFVNHSYRELPAANLLFWLLGFPVIILMIKPPLEFVINRKSHPGKRFTVFTPVDFFMEWIVGILEIFSGYLANTLSFMRVAGLGIAHVSLMIAFFKIAGMVSGDEANLHNIWSYLILILGNLLVIGLEGLTAGIQSLRLNYYEFFSKYFSGSGTAYSPISLRGSG